MKTGKRKKHIAAVISAAVITTGTISISGAAMTAGIDDVISLQKAVAGIDTIKQDYDVNEDGKVNVFDLSVMKNLAHKESGEIKDTVIPISSEYVKFTGRHITKDSSEWLLQSGSAVEFKVTGTKASAVLNGGSFFEADKDHRPRYAVFVDGELILDKTIDEKEETVTLFEEQSRRTAEVKIMLLSEATSGPVGVSSINVSSDAAVPVKPLPNKKLLIEFIGDSITCAYGVEGKSSSDPFKTTTENFSKSYAYLAAKQLDADYSAVSYSGHGIVSGYSSGDKNSDCLVPDFYSLTSRLPGYDLPWDFKERETDAVFINLGTNDINYVTADYETRSEEFIKGYIDFLKTIRSNNPKAAIICTMGIMGGDEDIYPLIEKAVEEYTAETGDDNIICYKSSVHNITADGIGSDWHPSEITQQNNGYIAADKICKALGIESSGTGLDAAADGIYDVELNEEAGAYAAFFVGYDKSFWINMTEGGTSPEDVKGVISGIELKAGGEYRLEFDCTATPDADVPVLVTGSSEYMSDSVSASSDKQHFEKTFTVSQKDNDAAIIFKLGGKSYYNVTISNLKLVKIN